MKHTPMVSKELLKFQELLNPKATREKSPSRTGQKRRRATTEFYKIEFPIPTANNPTIIRRDEEQ